MGQVRTGHKSPRERWLHQCRASCITFSHLLKPAVQCPPQLLLFSSLAHFFSSFFVSSVFLSICLSTPPPPRSSHSLIFSFSSHASYLLPTFSMQTSKFFEAVVKQKQSSQQHKHTETQNTERNDASTGWQTPARHTQSRWARICALGQHHPHPQRHNPCRRGRRSAR